MTMEYEVSNPIISLLLISLPLLTLIPSLGPSPLPNISPTSANMTSSSSNSSGLSSEQLEWKAQLEQLVEEKKQKGEQASPDANTRETITIHLTCAQCDQLNGKYNITVGMPEIDSPWKKSIVVNGSIFDPDNTQMGFIPFELEQRMDDEVIDILMEDVNTGNFLVKSLDMSKTRTVDMVWRQFINYSGSPL